MPGVTAFIVNFLTLVLLSAMLVGGARSIARLWRMRRDPPEPRRPVPWHGGHVLAIIAVSIVLQATMALAFGFQRRDAEHDAAERDPSASDELTAEDARAVLLGAALGNLLAVVAGVVALRYAVGANVDDLGFSVRQWRDDIRLGFGAFLAVIVPVYAIQWALSHLVQGQHPIERWIRSDPQPSLLVAAALAAVVAAPIAEEFFFRVLLQGWLERRWPVERVDGVVIDEDPIGSNAVDSAPIRATRLTPIIISAAIFALLHVGRSAKDLRSDPIPLFVLAMMLGWLYQRTHRIWPSMVVHVCLNGLSMTALIVDVLGYK